MMAICPAGPPKLMKPSFNQKTKASWKVRRSGTSVKVSVVKVNPRAEVVFYGTVNLPRKGDEATAVRFSVDRDGRVTGVNTLAKTLVERI